MAAGAGRDQFTSGMHMGLAMRRRCIGCVSVPPLVRPYCGLAGNCLDREVIVSEWRSPTPFVGLSGRWIDKTSLCQTVSGSGNFRDVNQNACMRFRNHG
jgi:hypothetical protein